MFGIIRYLDVLFNGPKAPEKPRELRMYVLVRQDLAETYRMVQGAHAVAQYSYAAMKGITDKDYSVFTSLYKTWNNQYLIFLGVPNLIALREWRDKLQCKPVLCCFSEPDLDGQETAIACIDTGEIFSGLPLAR
jgi:peptidyl-tRNA hydrolase